MVGGLEGGLLAARVPEAPGLVCKGTERALVSVESRDWYRAPWAAKARQPPAGEVAMGHGAAWTVGFGGCVSYFVAIVFCRPG